MHNISQCTQKLVALLDAVEKLDVFKKDELVWRIDNAKELARELKNERDFILKR